MAEEIQYRNLLRDFLLAQRELHPKDPEHREQCEPCSNGEERRKYGYWAQRWNIKNEATLRRWARGDRRIGPGNRHIFEDPLVQEFRFADDPELRFNMDSYYR